MSDEKSHVIYGLYTVNDDGAKDYFYVGRTSRQNPRTRFRLHLQYHRWITDVVDSYSEEVGGAKDPDLLKMLIAESPLGRTKVTTRLMELGPEAVGFGILESGIEGKDDAKAQELSWIRGLADRGHNLDNVEA